uniref:BLE2 protein n=1 Tax=Oryza nivara TaxID=4536 RepID=A0A0E0I4Y5_ORYNI
MVVAADITGGEHRDQMPAQGSGGGRRQQQLAAPEKQLNCFVHVVAMVERTGNALGTLAFTWATVVLLGGYPTVLRPEDDFWFATTMVFLEAARMFSRDNRLDYQLFFSTRGAFRLLGWSGLLTVVVYFSVVLVILSRSLGYIGANVLVALLVDMAMLLALGQLLSPAALKLLCDPLGHAISLWSPLLAILLIGPCITVPKSNYSTRGFTYTNSKTQWITYLVLSFFVLLATISRLRLPCIRKLADSFPNTKQLAWRQIIQNLCMLAAMVMLVVFISGELNPYSMLVYQLCALVVVSFGNFQIPAAVVRVVLALLRLVPQNYFADHSDGKKDSEKNLEPSLNIFYGMVLGQGILYIVACLLEVFSFIPRRYLIRRGGFGGQMGVEYVNLYYAYAFEKCMGGAVLAPKKISLITFAMDSLNSDSSRKKLYGVQMMHSFLKKEQLRTKTITKLTNATKTVASLFDMLGWTSDGDEEIRLFAAKVTAELAGSLRVVQIPGATQLVASLLDTDHQQRSRDHFLFIDSQVGREDSPIQQVGVAEQDSPVLKYLKQMAIYCLIPVDEPSNMHQRNSCMLRWWKRITKRWSLPEEEPSTDQDFLPIQGLLILERLANFDPGNCMEISRTTGLISKMIDFISYRNHMTSTSEAHQIMLASLSLKVLRRLASTEGKLGVTLRQQILEHTFVLSNLAEIMDDNGSSHELKQLAAEILKNLAMDRNTSEDIGHIRVIISSLMREFLSQDPSSSRNSNHLLRKNAGQALAMLAMESTDNCLIMLMEPGYVFIRELTTMIHDDRYKCIAASLLWNMCEHAQPELSNSDLKELSYILREVLEGIMDVEGAELEVLIGLSSQICQVIPEDFTREVEHGQIKEKLVKRLVDVFNAHMKPSAHCPSIRRVIVQHAIYLMEFNSRYANDFHKCWMVEALSMVERTPSRSENYRLFSGDTGLMKHNAPLSALVARAKELMGREWVRGISSVT